MTALCLNFADVIVSHLAAELHANRQVALYEVERRGVVQRIQSAPFFS